MIFLMNLMVWVEELLQCLLVAWSTSIPIEVLSPLVVNNIIFSSDNHQERIISSKIGIDLLFIFCYQNGLTLCSSIGYPQLIEWNYLRCLQRWMGVLFHLVLAVYGSNACFLIPSQSGCMNSSQDSKMIFKLRQFFTYLIQWRFG